MKKIFGNLRELEKLIENDPIEIDSDGKMFKLNDENFLNFQKSDFLV